MRSSDGVISAGEGLMACRVQEVQVALQKDARLLLIQRAEGFDNLSCLERVTSAQISSKTPSFASESVSTEKYIFPFYIELCTLISHDRHVTVR